MTPAERIKNTLNDLSNEGYWYACQDALAALDELLAERGKWERLHDEMYDAISAEHRRDSFGETETAAECIRRVIAERDALRAKLEVDERALDRLRNELADALDVRSGMRSAPTALAAVMAEREALRAKLAEYERALTVAITGGQWGEAITYQYPFSDKYPPIGTELIARPRKDGE